MSLDIYVSCPCCGSSKDYNITHNLGRMAREAGVYDSLWRDDECAAGSLVGPITAALRDLRARPQHYRRFNPPNGWGTYEGLVEVLADLRSHCARQPEAVVRVSR